MPKISIIMPVYNGKDFLEASINSVLNQSFKDFELICVNDSSTDNSEEILKTFNRKDSKVLFYTKENEGPGMALNYGILKASGEYLCFLDQDDKYSEKYLETMLNSIENNGCEVSICNAYLWEDDKLTRIPYPQPNKKSKMININTTWKKKLFSTHYFPQWTKIVKRDFWLKHKIEFPSRENKAHDVPVHYQIIGLIDKIGYIEECLYHHRYHSNQISYNLNTGLYYYLTAENVISWLNSKHQIKNHKKIKKFLKYIIRVAIRATDNFAILDRIKNLVKINYDSFERIEFQSMIKMRKAKLIRIDKQLRKKNIKVEQKVYLPNVGKNTYCASQPVIATIKTSIGSFCSIGRNVTIGHGEHPLNFVSTSPYFYFDNLGFKSKKMVAHNEFWNCEPITIGNDVWIGDNVSIKNGIKIADGAIIGMNAVVTKDVPPYSIVVGCPAKIIRYRFSEEVIKELLKLKWWELQDDIIKQIPYDNINETMAFIKKQRGFN